MCKIGLKLKVDLELRFQIRIKFQRGRADTYSTEGPNQLKVVFDSSFTAIHDFKGVDFCLFEKCQDIFCTAIKIKVDLYKN